MSQISGWGLVYLAFMGTCLAVGLRSLFGEGRCSSPPATTPDEPTSSLPDAKGQGNAI